MTNRIRELILFNNAHQLDGSPFPARGQRGDSETAAACDGKDPFTPNNGPQNAAEPLTNDLVIELKAAGVPEDVIISEIDDLIPEFKLAPRDLIALKRSGVSDKVVSRDARQAERSGRE